MIFAVWWQERRLVLLPLVLSCFYFHVDEERRSAVQLYIGLENKITRKDFFSKISACNITKFK